MARRKKQGLSHGTKKSKYHGKPVARKKGLGGVWVDHPALAKLGADRAEWDSYSDAKLARGLPAAPLPGSKNIHRIGDVPKAATRPPRNLKRPKCGTCGTREGRIDPLTGIVLCLRCSKVRKI